MADVQCVTCGRAGEAITDMLFLGKLEARSRPRSVSPAGRSGKGWVMVINSIKSIWVTKVAANWSKNK